MKLLFSKIKLHWNNECTPNDIEKCVKSYIAVIDASSRALPYDYYYISEVSKYYKIDFYYSKTKFNYEYIEFLRKNKNVNLLEYNISGYNRMISLFGYLKLLRDIYKNRKKYKKIHFFWSLFFLIEYPLFYKIKDKIIFTFHNDRPHEKNVKVYLPYKIIYNISSKNIFVSNFTKTRFINNYKIKDKKYLVLNHGLLPLQPNEEKINKKNVEIENTIIFWGLVKDYKGVDIFLELANDSFLNKYNFEIIGKWDKRLNSLKNRLLKYKNIKIYDKFLSLEDMHALMKRNVIFILPYKDATQSGVLYTFLNYSKVFISSNVGENFNFLKENNLKNLIFDRKNKKSIHNAIEYARNNFYNIENQLDKIKKKYQWKNILTEKIIKDLYG